MKVIAYQRADGGVSICNPAPGWIAELMTNDVPADAANVEVMDRSALPTSREFRNAWEKPGVGAPQVNMPKARMIHMTRIRRHRDVRLLELDVEYIRADESKDQVEKDRITALKQELRDLPSTFDLSIYPTPETLSASWPEVVPRGAG